MDGLWNPSYVDPSSPTLIGAGGRSMSFAQRAMSFAQPAGPSTKIKYPGKRVAQIVKLKKDCVQKYKECHAKVWPEVLMQIKQSNIEDYSIFYDDSTGILFASFKYVGYDWEGDMSKMRENDKVREWWKMTDSYQESVVPGAVSSEAGGFDGVPSWWKGIEEVFYYP